MDRVILLDDKFNIIADTDTLDLDPRSFSRNFEIVETDILNNDRDIDSKTDNKIVNDQSFLKDKFLDYSKSKSFNSLFTFTHEHNDQFLLKEFFLIFTILMEKK